MEIKYDILDDGVIVKLSGEISLEDKEKLEEGMKEVIQTIAEKNHRFLKLDLSEVVYIDSIGISYLIRLNKDMKILGVEFGFLNVPKMVRRILAMLSIESMFNIYE